MQLMSANVNSTENVPATKSEFISVASHALRTPLGIAKWYIEALLKQPDIRDAPQIVREYIDEIYRSNERSLALVRNLLSASRINQGKVQDTPQIISVRSLLKKVLQSLQILTKKQHITIHLIIKGDYSEKIRIDPIRLQEVFENLISNAIKYNKPHGEITVTFVQEKQKLSLSVADTGIGIATKDQKNLFTQFFRAEKAIINNTEGSGLGLYVVKSYVEDWGGNVSLESIEGKGTTIKIEIPIKKTCKGVII